MLKLRPHHFLCMKAFIGKGYSEEFTENMKKIMMNLEANPNQKINLIVDIDDLCKKCPNTISDNVCVTNEKVIDMDNKVRKYFKLQEGICSYLELSNYIFENINEEIIKDVCSGCNWYSITNCKDLILQ